MPRTHSSLPRLFVEPGLSAGEVLTLGPEPSNHVVGVLRLREGDAVIVFNGRDGAWLASIVEPARRAARLRPEQQIATQPPPSDLWLGFAPLKSARLEYVVQKATEMGAGIIQPVITRFTQVTRLRHDKLHAYAVEAAQQCEVLTVPRIEPEIDLKPLLAGWQERQGLRRLLFADERAPSGSPLRALREVEGLSVGLLVGPEGGFSDEERNLLLEQPFVMAISLGPRILRADTAAVAALAVIQASIGDWR